MRNFTRNFKMFTLAIALFSMSAGAVGQGLETFDNLNAGIGTNYGDGSFVGNGGITWNYTSASALDASGSVNAPINGKSILLRHPSSELIANSIPGGIGSFECKFRKAFTGGANRVLELYINDNLVGESTDNAGGGSGENSTIYTFKIDDINVAGTFKMQIKIKGTGTSNAQTVVDDIKWTGYVSSDPIVNTPVNHTFSTISINNISTENINIKGSNLTGDLTISVSGDAFSTTVSTVSQADATAGFDIPVKFAPTARGVFSGQLIISGGGLEDNVNVALSGTAYELIEVNSISQLYSKDVTLANTRYKLTSEAVVTFDYTKNRGQYYIQDATAGLLIDDASKLIATKFSEGDGMKNIEGTLSLYYGVLQFVATSDATKSSTGNSVTPKTITLEQLVTGNYVSQLIKVVNVSISGTGSFEAKKSYAINDDVDVRTFDFTYTAIISEVKNIIGIAVEYTTSTSTKYQISPRSDADLINVPTAIGNLVNDQSIYVQNGQLIVVAQNSGAMVEVYNIAGQRVATQATDAGRNVITLPKGQIYIVKVGNTVKKVAL